MQLRDERAWEQCLERLQFAFDFGREGSLQPGTQRLRVAVDQMPKPLIALPEHVREQFDDPVRVVVQIVEQCPP